MNTPIRPKAYSYIRFSTPEQIKGDSLRRQTDRSAAYAREHDLDLDQTLCFRDLGVSAFNKSNLRSGAQLRAFLDAIDQGIVTPGSYLLVESLDRISRAQILDALEIFTGILNRGIIVVTLADNMEYSKEKANRQFTDLIISITIMSRAHEESLTKSGRLKEAWNSKRKNIDQIKLTKVCPAWLQLRPDRTAYEAIPEKVAIVERIVDMVMSGMGKNAIAKKFNLEGMPSIGNRNKEHTWFPSYIVKIVTSRALIGEFQPKQVIDGKRIAAGETIANYFPSVIPPERFALLQQLISERGKRSGGNRGKLFSNLFTGFLKCGYCGSSMVFVNKGDDKRRNGNSEKNRFLVCTKAKRGAGCHHIPWVYTEFEEAFIRDASGIDFQRFVRDAADQTSTIRYLSEQRIVKQAEYQDLAKRQEALVEAIEIGGGQIKPLLDKITINATRISELETQISELEQEIKSANSLESISKDTLEVIQELLEQLITKTGDDLFLLRARINEHLRRVVRELLMFPGGTIHTETEVQNIVSELKSQPSNHFTEADIDSFARDFLPTAPRKNERYFVIKSGDRELQIVRPNHNFPDFRDVMLNNPEQIREWREIEKTRREIIAKKQSRLKPDSN